MDSNRSPFAKLLPTALPIVASVAAISFSLVIDILNPHDVAIALALVLLVLLLMGAAGYAVLHFVREALAKHAAHFDSLVATQRTTLDEIGRALVTSLAEVAGSASVAGSRSFALLSESAVFALERCAD